MKNSPTKETELQLYKNEESQLEIQYPLYRARFLMAGFFAFSTISSSMMFATCNPIAAELTEVYGISPFIVSLSSNGFLLMHPLLTFLQTYIVNKYSASLSIRIGCALTLLGALIRTLTTYTQMFSTIILGQFIAGMGRPFIINIQANVAQEWFRKEDKTTIMIAFNFLITCSSILGILIPSIIFDDYEVQEDATHQQGKDLTSQLMNVEVIIFAILLIPPILCFRSKPPTPPGPPQKTQQIFSYGQSLSMIRQNRPFVLLFCCYTLIMGGFHALAVVISFLFAPYGYTPVQISYIQSAPILCGFFSSITYSYLIRKYKPNLKKIVILSLIPVLGVMATLYIVISIGIFFFILLTFAILGVFMIPVIPLQLELACRVVHPINPSMAVGFLLAGVHLWSFIFGESLAYVTNQQTKFESFIGCLLLFISFLVAFGCFSLVNVPRNDEMEDTQNHLSQTTPITLPGIEDSAQGPI